MIENDLKKELKKAVLALQKECKCSFEIPVIELTTQTQNHGDYASNLALKIGKLQNTNPREVATNIANKLKSESLERVEVAGPGFINFWLSKEYYAGVLGEILKQKTAFGALNLGKNQKVVIDYSAPNIAKPFSVGHLRSTIIGDSLYKLYNFLGYKAISENFIGDWGTQFGKLIYACKTWGDNKNLKKDPIKELLRLYVRFHAEAEKNPSLDDFGREEFKKMELGDKTNLALLSKFTIASFVEFNKIYKILGVKFDFIRGESYFQKDLPGVIAELKKKKLVKESRGALIVELDDVGLPPALVQRTDGATLYLTRDLAALKNRIKKLGAKKLVYVVGGEQTLHLRQLFSVAQKMGFKNTEFEHVGFGLYRLESGKMSTRKGKVIFLEDLINTAIGKAESVINKKRPDLLLSSRKKIAQTVAINAIKYNDLSQNRKTDIVFDYAKMLSFEGNSAPYLMYVYSRACSILKKGGKFKPNIKTENLGEHELKLLKVLNQFSGVLINTLNSSSPNLLCNYLYELAGEFNRYYERVPVLKAEQTQIPTKLALILATKQVLHNGFAILGLEPSEKM